VFAAAARRLSEALKALGIGLVYGGGRVGLMGLLADAMLQCGGDVIGVIPESLQALEVAHEGLSDLRVVASMHARKALMADLSDGFIALPGGLGTFEELLEIATWSQLGLHSKPVGIFNVAGYFDPLLALLDHAVVERFLQPDHRQLFLVATEPQELLRAMVAFRAPTATAGKWLDRDRR